MKPSIQRVAHQYLNKIAGGIDWATNETLYKKYMATIRKALIPLGFAFSRVTAHKGHQDNFVRMDLEWGGFKGWIVLKLGYWSYHGRKANNNSVAIFTLKRPNNDSITKDGTWMRHDEPTNMYSPTWKDLSTSDIRAFINTIKQKYEGQDAAGVEQNEKAYIKSLWSSSYDGTCIRLPNGYQFCLAKVSDGYVVLRTGNERHWRDEGFVYAENQNGPKGAWGARYDGMTKSKAIAIAEREALKAHTTNN